MTGFVQSLGACEVTRAVQFSVGGLTSSKKKPGPTPRILAMSNRYRAEMRLIFASHCVSCKASTVMLRPTRAASARRSAVGRGRGARLVCHGGEGLVHRHKVPARSSPIRCNGIEANNQ